MMFKRILSLALFTSAAFAQSIRIGYPPEGTSVIAGSNVTVQIQLPPTLTNTQPISVAIGLQSCPSGNCLPVADILGDLLYAGPIQPVYGPGAYYPYQNFSVTVPPTIANGTAQIGVAYFSLIGAGLYPFFQLLNETVNVV
ncbi:hypothetical protein SERLA73DRAFT_187021 [Serpula lacrymans var. lacrymans S7.3]|uniref:Uncharacterized protein n=2 Tax=Serpula lacrymans var. lacrymans TaxID=341189 RepID=F8Q8B1_SERL3|nr:uncharacterized protein SERLADRAFT_476354 [Serpula lacrymans var. lacrymans S7.9]EGN95799.1 hypothetical protein SERLA73DRAFT_187021 [Serpula lacrymans var. lacrymans S7.3]EGO21319.1 hypothetical protein SERLADRAFT_476354 [Serpula lacrymans var. lacrymans S7.9]